MNDAFAWDIGDLAKFVLLRSLAMPADGLRLPLAVVWCRTRSAPPMGHGRHTTYLDDGDAYGKLVRTRDAKLYELMRSGLRAGRSIATDEYRRVLPPDTVHVLGYLEREQASRADYWVSGLAATRNAAVVFFDPDNGVARDLPASDPERYVSYSELEPFFERGQTVVFYQHQNRSPGGLAGLAAGHCALVRNRFGRRATVLGWHRVQARLFVVAPSPDHEELLARNLRSLLSSPWASQRSSSSHDIVDDTPRIRRANEADAPVLRAVLNEAYRPLADAGLNFTAATQGLELTAQHVREREVYLLAHGSELLGTITLRDRLDDQGVRHIYINSLAVRRHLQRQGLGRFLLSYAEEVANDRGVDVLRLDTAVPAKHLTEMYARADYAVVGHRHWEGKTYDSVVMEKVLAGRTATQAVR